MRINHSHNARAGRGFDWNLSPHLILQKLRLRAMLWHRKSRDLSDYPSPKPTRIQVALWGVLLVVTVVLSLKGLHSIQVGMNKDSTDYIILAHSLVHSDKYGLMNVPGEPDDSKYPFGYPLLLAPFVLLFPNNLGAMKLPSLIATLTNVTLLFWGWRWFSRYSYWWGLAVVGLYALHPMTVRFSSSVVSDPIFTTFCLVAMLLAVQAALGKWGYWRSLLMSVALTFVIFTRTIGVAVAISIFAYLLFIKDRRVWKELILIVAQMAILIALIVGTTSVEAKTVLPLGYVREEDRRAEVSLNQGVEINIAENFLVSRPTWFVTHNLRIIMARAVLPIGDPEEHALAKLIGIPYPMGLLVFGLVILGYFRWLTKEGLSMFNLLPIFYLGALSMWVWNTKRFFYPVIPQLHFALLLGAELILLWTTSFLERANSYRFLRNSHFSSNGLVVTAVIILIFASGVRSFITTSDSRLHVGDLQARSSWLKSYTTSSAIVMTEWPHLDFVYSGRKTVSYPASSASLSELETYLEERDIDYILIGPEFKSSLVYTPTYSDETLHFLSLIEHLVSENRVELVYALEQDLVKIFEVRSWEQ